MNKDTKKKILITSIILVAIVGIFILLYFLLGLNKYFTDADFIKEKIESYGNLGKFVYILINLLQTTIIPVTNIPTIFAGTYVYGPFEGATLAIIGVLIGSVISFYVGRIFGTKLLRWILGDKELDKYLDMMKGREKVVFFLTMLLPGFPDDIICMVAGITPMRFRFFSITLLITRTIPIYLTAYGASLIRLDTVWGWVIWIAIYVIIFYIGQKILRHWVEILARFKGKNKGE
ncbi:TVP38/TMEM64 family protein [Acholeplasma laidlawii]|uniref:TVP38/TMEM64 family protein n=1 Tax=Acholeplasma laidlawii TaxID=2148 RepID=UPI0021F6C1FA|nr:VTT domain-containing protein [Acholeplasma laidlawii]